MFTADIDRLPKLNLIGGGGELYGVEPVYNYLSK